MRKIVLIFILAISVIGFSSMTSTENPAAKIEFDKLIHDFGKIPQGKPVKVVFKFTNTGNDVLLLTNVVKSCGCTTPVFSTEPVLPKQKGTIELGFDAQSVGAFNKKVTVFSNAENDQIILTIKGEVVN